MRIQRFGWKQLTRRQVSAWRHQRWLLLLLSVPGGRGRVLALSGAMLADGEFQFKGAEVAAVSPVNPFSECSMTICSGGVRAAR